MADDKKMSFKAFDKALEKTSGVKSAPDDMYRVELLQDSLFNAEITLGNINYFMNELYRKGWEYVDNIPCAVNDGITKYVFLIFKRRTTKKDPN